MLVTLAKFFLRHKITSDPAHLVCEDVPVGLKTKGKDLHSGLNSEQDGEAQVPATPNE